MFMFSSTENIFTPGHRISTSVQFGSVTKRNKSRRKCCRRKSRGKMMLPLLFKKVFSMHGTLILWLI